MTYNVTEFLAKFESITFDNTDERKAIIGSFRGHEIKISYRLNVDTSFLHAEDYMVQVVMYIHVDGVYADSWGCVDNQQNSEVLRWIHTRMNKALSMKMKDECYKEEEAKRLLKSLV